MRHLLPRQWDYYRFAILINVKFLDVVEPTLSVNIEIPKQIEEILHKEKEAKFINTYSDLKAFLNSEKIRA